MLSKLVVSRWNLFKRLRLMEQKNRKPPYHTIIGLCIPPLPLPSFQHMYLSAKESKDLDVNSNSNSPAPILLSYYPTHKQTNQSINKIPPNFQTQHTNRPDPRENFLFIFLLLLPIVPYLTLSYPLRLLILNELSNYS